MFLHRFHFKVKGFLSPTSACQRWLFCIEPTTAYHALREPIPDATGEPIHIEPFNLNGDTMVGPILIPISNPTHGATNNSTLESTIDPTTAPTPDRTAGP